MPLDSAFLEDCLYGGDAVLVDEILEVDPAAGRVRASIPTPATLPLTRDQRGDERVHPRHVSGGLMVHATGILGFVHAYHVLGLRHADGWVGFGTHIHDARFRALATLGPPLVAECLQVRLRKLAGNLFIRYRFTFTQAQGPGDPTVVYESEQSAVWRRGVPREGTA
jgi:hypothetical protein